MVGEELTGGGGGLRNRELGGVSLKYFFLCVMATVNRPQRKRVSLFQRKLTSLTIIPRFTMSLLRDTLMWKYEGTWATHLVYLHNWHFRYIKKNMII